jgi:hypothetical protein
MHETYDLILECQDLDFVSQKKILTSMAKQTQECAYFIQKYLKTERFSNTHLFCPYFPSLIEPLAARAFKHILSSADKTIEKYQKQFRDLSAAFQGSTTLQTELLVIRVLDEINQVGM